MAGFLNASFRQWFWNLVYRWNPELFPAQQAYDALLSENANLREALETSQDEVVLRGKALKCQDQLYELDRERWHRQFGLLANEIVAKNGELLALEHEAASLKKLVGTDPLTGLVNRDELARRFKQEFSVLARSLPHPPPTRSEKISLLAIDIDHFKLINETYGHPAGDLVIGTLATFIKNELGHRPNDIHARVGGEEFMVVLPIATTEEATAQAENFRQMVEQSVFVVTDLRGNKVTLRVTLSCGVATIEVTDRHQLASVAFEQLYALADRALNRAKHGEVRSPGRNQVVHHDQLPKE